MYSNRMTFGNGQMSSNEKQSQKTDNLQRKPRDGKPLDQMDRKILGALTENAEQSYADLGSRVGLSAPAVHERVKRLKNEGRIKHICAQLDGGAVGKPFLAFVHIDTKGWGKSEQMMAISDFPEVEEIHSVAGDTCMLLKVRVQSSDALEGLLSRLYEMDVVISTKSYVVLSTYLERPVQAGISDVLTAR